MSNFISKFIKKPIEVEAFQFNGSSTHADELKKWMSGEATPVPHGIHTRDIVDLKIDKLEGVMTAKPGDWIIKGVEGELYPCKPNIFKANYDSVE